MSFKQKGTNDPTPMASGFCFICYSPEEQNPPIRNSQKFAAESYQKHSHPKRIDDEDKIILQFAYLLRYESHAGADNKLIKFNDYEKALQHTENQGHGVILKLNHDLKINYASELRVIDQFDPDFLTIMYYLDWMKHFNQEPILNKKYEWRGFLSEENTTLITQAAENTLLVTNKYLALNPSVKKSLFGAHYDKQDEARALLAIAETFLQAKSESLAELRRVYIQFVEDFVGVVKGLPEKDPLNKALESQVYPQLRASINKTCSARPVGGGAYLISLVNPVKQMLEASEFAENSSPLTLSQRSRLL